MYKMPIFVPVMKHEENSYKQARKIYINTPVNVVIDVTGPQEEQKQLRNSLYKVQERFAKIGERKIFKTRIEGDLLRIKRIV